MGFFMKRCISLQRQRGNDRCECVIRFQSRCELIILGFVVSGGTMLTAHAGMTVITLTDIAEARLQSISFFCAVYLLSALGVKGMWNYLGKSFDWMPRINYRRALTLLIVSGLFLYVVLTMVSGARELLTPGAWKKKGIGYELSHGVSVPEPSVRKKSMQQLRDRLWRHAENHEGKLPSGLFDASFELDRWSLPEVPGYYAYVSGRTVGEGVKVLVYEPSVMGDKRFVLLADGSVEVWKDDELRKALIDE
jgi:hypothetical protein